MPHGLDDKEVIELIRAIARLRAEVKENQALINSLRRENRELKENKNE